MKKQIITSLFFIVFLFISNSSGYANSCEDKTCNKESSSYTSCLEDKKSCLEKKLNDTQEKKVTLENTISIISGSINIQQIIHFKT
jgi:peptidoglycan hydrolase CwlO-like protein